MKVITAVKKYINTDKDIYLECENDGTFIKVPKDKDFHLEFGCRIADTKVKRIDTEEGEEAVTIYI